MIIIIIAGVTLFVVWPSMVFDNARRTECNEEHWIFFFFSPNVLAFTFCETPARTGPNSVGCCKLNMIRAFARASVVLLLWFQGFEKMERGLSERYNDRVSPVKRHMDHMVSIGAAPGLVNPQLNTMTSDVIKVREQIWLKMSLKDDPSVDKE